jgi:hypothetical protein
VLVHVAEDFHDRMDRGRHTWILDMDPTTKTIDGLTMGKSFTDPAGGTSFQVVALSMDSATIQVTLPSGTGPATCLDNTMYDPAVPRMCGGVVGTATPDTGTTTPDGGTSVTPPPRVEGFVLVDASTGKDIRPVEDMATLDLDQLPPNLTLRVDTDPPVVGSVSFRIDAGAPYADSMAPYSITNDFTPWTLALGAHTVNAVASDAANGGGRPGEPYAIDFMLTRSGLTTPGGDAPIMGRGLIPQPGAAGGALFTTAGVGATVSPMLASPSAGAAGGAPVVMPPRGDPPPSCSCRVVGAGAATNQSARAWALLAIAFGSIATRRRLRAKNRRTV